MEKKILFLCTGNSCRSQMAEGFAKNYLKNYKISSAGIFPEPLNPYAIKVMQQIDIDISDYKSKKIDKNNFNKYDLIITLCGDAKDKCPVISKSKHIHWDIDDPSKYKDNNKNLIIKYSKIRDIIITRVKLLTIELTE